mmetsp:Transcript_93610/g.260621  ORF Transcript_93610/g.260621 Transcript_93610/m.260621 type:complete len:176 (+) Transcript_93610:186-713(+)
MSKISVLTTEDSKEKAGKIRDAVASLEDAASEVEEVRSYYWWEEKVNFDPEWRVKVTTASGFPAVCECISKAHSYDLPMIIYDLPEAAEGCQHWKGVVACADEAAAIELAQGLVEKRVVACAQATAQGGLAVKTVAACKDKVEALAGTGAVAWSAIGGNEGYLKWLEDECTAAKS